MNREIPGYYYDEEKKRYFKIEDSKTAPNQASWANGNVKRRKVEDQEEEARRKREAKKVGRIKRAVGVWDEPLAGGCFLRREIGGTGMREMDDLGAESWTMGLRDKGSLKMWSGFVVYGADVTLMYIGGGETEAKSGLGVAYAVLGGDSLMSSYIPRDDQDQINFGYAAARYPSTTFHANVETLHAPSICSLSYHAPSNKMLLASSQQHPSRVGVAYFSPRLSAESSESQPAWRLGGGNSAVCLHSDGKHPSGPKAVHTVKAAPACSSATGVVGTTHGIVKLQDDNLSWLTWCLPAGKRSQHQAHSRGGRSRDVRPLHGEVLSLDFLAQNPAEVILAGGRSSDICLLDMRCSQQQGMVSYIQHKSPVAHVRSVGDYEVLAAGPTSSMALYDVRFSSYRRQDQNNTTPFPRPHPVIKFPEYHNEPHLLQIGLDVSDRKNGGLGIVAAAQDDGTVALFSLKSGRKLRSSVVDAIKVQKDGDGRVVKSLMFQTLPGDRHPSLFVGQKAIIKKYSFGMSYSKGGGVVFEDED